MQNCNADYLSSNGIVGNSFQVPTLAFTFVFTNSILKSNQQIFI